MKAVDNGFHVASSSCQLPPAVGRCQLQPVVSPRNKAPLRPETVGITRHGGSFHVRPFKPRPPRREEVSRSARFTGQFRTLVALKISHPARASSVPIRPLSSVGSHSLPHLMHVPPLGRTALGPALGEAFERQAAVGNQPIMLVASLAHMAHSTSTAPGLTRHYISRARALTVLTNRHPSLVPPHFRFPGSLVTSRPSALCVFPCIQHVLSEPQAAASF